MRWALQSPHEEEGTEEGGEEAASADDLFDISEAAAEPDGDAVEDLLGDAIEPEVDAAAEDIPSEDIPAAEAENAEAGGEEPIVDLLDTDIPDAMLDVPEPEAAPAEEELPGPEIEIELPEPEPGEGGEQMTYTYYQNNVKPKPATEGKKGYVCKVCGYVYEGDELPEDFICPLCKHPASDFEPIS